MSISPEPGAGRLNGWKEIARHLGKGTRTVQRWEKLYGLPVHRIGREGGEIVFAFRDEIDRWMVDTPEATAPEGEPQPPAPSAPGALPAPVRRGRRRAVAGGLVALGVLALGVWWAVQRQPGAEGRAALTGKGQPAAWRMGDESLTVSDSTGALLFEYRFDFPLEDSTSSETWDPDIEHPPVLIADIDGDGRREVLVRARAVDRANRRLYCFEGDGRLRFVHQPTGSRHFGDDEFAEPWLVHRVFVPQRPGGARRLWVVFIHNLLFPSVLQELDPRSGSVRQEYWSDGFIGFVAEVSWKERPVVLVGAGNNDFRAASLAVFPPDGVTGAAPAARPAYACRDCAPGGPADFFLFPSLCLTRRLGVADVTEAWVERGDRLRVMVMQEGRTATYYTLGPDGTPLAAEVSPELQARHALLERQGVLDHPFGAADLRDMFPVRRWDGRRFVELPRVPVTY